MKVLLSIHPKYAEQILNGTKRYEYRRSIFKDETVNTIVIYATLPVGKVVGEFSVAAIIRDEPGSLWMETKEFSGITEQFFMSYFCGRNEAIAIRVEDPKRYPKPLDLAEVSGNSVAPQSFRYLR